MKLNPDAAALCERIIRAGGGGYSGRTIAEIRRSGFALAQMWALDDEALELIAGLSRAGSPLSAAELAERTHRSLDRVDDYLTLLLKSGFVRFKTRHDGTREWSELTSGHRRAHSDVLGAFALLAGDEADERDRKPLSWEHETHFVVSPGIEVRLYRPATSAPHAVVMFIHGGAWVSGTIEAYDSLCHSMAELSGAAIASVEYRLLPEHPFPTQSDDCGAVLRWLLAHGDDLNLDTTRLALMGDSAGGALATVVALEAHRDHVCLVSSLVLFYPVLDATMSAPSLIENAHAPLYCAEDVSWMYQLRNAPPDDWRASPLQCDFLSTAPPTLVITADVDPVRDDGQRFVERLIEVGIEAQWVNVEGMPHGFAMLAPALTAATDARQTAAQELRARLAVDANVA